MISIIAGIVYANVNKLNIFDLEIVGFSIAELIVEFSIVCLVLK